MAIPQLSTGGLTIDYPKNPYYAFNTTFSLNIHIFNSSNFQIANADASCMIHIYNQSHQAIIQTNLANDGNGVDKYLYLYGTNLTTPGIYSYTIACNSSNEYGFVSDIIDIREGGKPDADFNTFFIVVALLPMLIGLLFGIGAFTLGEKHNVFKIFAYLISLSSFLFSIWFTVQIIAKYYVFPEIINALVISLFVYGTLFAITLIYFVLYIFQLAVETAGKQKAQEIEY